MSENSAPAFISVLRQFHALTKPRVIQLIVFCALIGMVLAVAQFAAGRGAPGGTPHLGVDALFDDAVEGRRRARH